MSQTMVEVLKLVAAGVLRVEPTGEIWRVAVRRGSAVVPVEPRRAESKGQKGYLRIAIQMPSGAVLATGAHRVVWEALRGPIPPGMQINHKDLNKQNNAIDNLEVVTGAENIRHSYANGRTIPWSTDPHRPWRGRSRVNTAENVAAALRLRSEGASLKRIAEVIGASTSHVHRMLARASSAARQVGDGA